MQMQEMALQRQHKPQPPTVCPHSSGDGKVSGGGGGAGGHLTTVSVTSGKSSHISELQFYVNQNQGDSTSLALAVLKDVPAAHVRDLVVVRNLGYTLTAQARDPGLSVETQILTQPALCSLPMQV